MSQKLYATGPTDARLYQMPTVGEVAVIVVGSVEETPAAFRSVQLHQHNDGLYFFDDWHPAFESLHFVLLRPHGCLGWHAQMPMHGPRAQRLTLLRYAAFHMQHRTDNFNTLLRCARLYQASHSFCGGLLCACRPAQTSHLTHSMIVTCRNGLLTHLYAFKVNVSPGWQLIKPSCAQTATLLLLRMLRQICLQIRQAVLWCCHLASHKGVDICSNYFR